VYLCVHGAKHAWERIEWIGGVAELLRSQRVTDWDRVRRSTERLSADRALGSGLQLVTELFDVATPTIALRGDRSARAAAGAIAKRIRRAPGTIPGALTRLRHSVRVDERLRDRVWRVWSMFFEATLSERTAVPLPRALSLGYYLVRPMSIVMRRLRRFAWPQ
jgi:hypothetical protein